MTEPTPGTASELTVDELPRPGRFGDFGGRYVPETLVPALDELDEARQKAARRPRVPGRARAAARHVHGAAEHHHRGAPVRGALRRRARPAQARGPEPHRRAQDQQRRSARRCSRGAWARRASSPRPAPASTAWRPRRPRRCSASSATSTWAPRSTSSARRSTCRACSCSAPRSSPVEPAARTLKDAINEAMRDWVTNVDDTHYVIGSVLGPHPFPAMVRDFQRDHRRARRARRSSR